MVKGILEMFSDVKPKSIDLSCVAYLKSGGMVDCVVRVSRYIDVSESDKLVEVSFGVGTIVEIDSDDKAIEKIVNIYDYELSKIEDAVLDEFGSEYSVTTEEEIVIL